MAAVVTHVAIQASLLASGDDGEVQPHRDPGDSCGIARRPRVPAPPRALAQSPCRRADAGAALAVNRLVWGGLRVALVHATSGEELAPPPSALDDRVQHLSAAPPPAEGAAAGDLASWVASRPAPGTLLAVRSCEAQAPWAPQLEAGALLWRVEGSGARCGEQAQPATISCLAQLPACLARHQQTAGQALLGRPVQLVAHCMAAKRERELAGMSSSIPVRCARSPSCDGGRGCRWADRHPRVAVDWIDLPQGPGAAEEGGQHAYAGGLLSLVPQRCGLVFMPLDLDGDLDSQLPFQARAAAALWDAIFNACALAMWRRALRRRIGAGTHRGEAAPCVVCPGAASQGVGRTAGGAGRPALLLPTHPAAEAVAGGRRAGWPQRHPGGGPH